MLTVEADARHAALGRLEEQQLSAYQYDGNVLGTIREEALHLNAIHTVVRVRVEAGNAW